MKRSYLFLCFFIALAFSASAQEDSVAAHYFDENYSKKPLRTSFQKDLQPIPFQSPKRFQLGMEMGTSVGTTLGNGAMWSSYLAPHVSYRISPKWSLKAGTMIMNNQFNYSPYTRSNEAGFSGNTSSVQSFIYTQGQYQVNDRIRLTGTAFYETNRFMGPRMNPQATNFNSKGMSMHAEFKITDNFSFGAGAQISNGNPFIGNSLYRNQMLFPVGGSSFNRYDSW